MKTINKIKAQVPLSGVLRTKIIEVKRQTKTIVLMARDLTPKTFLLYFLLDLKDILHSIKTGIIFEVNSNKKYNNNVSEVGPLNTRKLASVLKSMIYARNTIYHISLYTIHTQINK